MARITPTHLLTMLPLSSSPCTVLITLLAILALLSTVIFLCGARRALTSTTDNVEKKKKTKNCVRLGAKNPARLHSTKALLMAKLTSWRKLQNNDNVEEKDDDDDDDDEQAIWKRTIIKGEKCRPVDFSGKILYDSNGNLIAE